jgi:RhtB (resistance to homoserine/threonine) family protein
MDIIKLSSIAFVSLLAAMSPGPDFALVAKNSLTGSFRRGLLTALGVGAALLIHATYCLLGIAVVIYESPLLFNVVKYMGAAYLFYLGIVLLKEKPSAGRKISDGKPVKHRPFVSGLVCNLLNPKATLFVLSLFTQFIDPGMRFLEKMAFGSVIAVVTFLWFALLSYLISHKHLQKHFARFQVTISKTMGIALCLLALFIAVKASP